MNTRKTHVIFIFILILLTLGDLWSKRAVFELVKEQVPRFSLIYPKYLDRYYSLWDTSWVGFQFLASYNKGATFGLGAGYNLKYGFIVFCGIALGALGYFYLKPALVIPEIAPVHYPWCRGAFILIAAGALGNLYDRIFFEGVRDFISVYFKVQQKIYPYPTFNVADAYICIGIGVLLVLSVIYYRKERALARSQKLTNPAS
jgi:lipoprotein signal peptidase